MSWSKVVRAAALGVGLSSVLCLSGCTGFRPVYSADTTAERVALFYGTPDNHYEQVLYDDLALRLGSAQPGSDAPKLIVNLGFSFGNLTNASPTYRARRVTVTARIRLIAADGRTLFSGVRNQSADYTSAQQILATDQAATDAAERASHALADQIRLTVLGILSK